MEGHAGHYCGQGGSDNFVFLLRWALLESLAGPFALSWLLHLRLQDKEMVMALIQLKFQLDAVLAEAFQRNDAFINALKDAFENFINQRQNK